MKRILRLRVFAFVAVLALALAACGGNGDGVTPTETDTEATETEATETATATEEAIDRPERDDVLDFGTVLPETGGLAFLGSPQIEGVNMAIEEINAAGGVLGQDVTLSSGDSGTDPAVARQTVPRLINGGADAVIGAAASGVSQEIIQTTHDNEIVQCSGSNTSSSFTDQENNTFYWRTVPPDEAVTPVIVAEVTGDGASNVAIAARADDYGQNLQELVVQGLEDAGVTIAANVAFDPEADDFSSEASEIAAADPDGIVLIAFGEGTTLIRQLIEQGVSPDIMYGADGLFGPALVDDVNPDDSSVLEGMKVIGASGDEAFNERLNERVDISGNLIYGAQFYDCVIIVALAAIAADSADPVAFNEQVGEVTRGGTQCATFEECKGLLEQGEDIDYQGASGPLDIEHPDPTTGRYAVGEFTAEGTITILRSEDVDLSQF